MIAAIMAIAKLVGVKISLIAQAKPRFIPHRCPDIFVHSGNHSVIAPM